MRRLTRCSAFAIVALVSGIPGSGCAPGKGDVTGKVTYNGVPLNKPDGNIVFVSPDGVQVVAPIAADGTYRATGVIRAQNKVAVYYPNPKFQELAKQPRKLPDRRTRPRSPRSPRLRRT